MANISKRKLKEKVFLEINERFIEVLTKLKNKKQSKLFFDDLFTSTERIMFAKRLAIIFMLIEDFPSGYIRKVLKVSPSTISLINNKLNNGNFSNIEKLLKKKQGKDLFANYINEILKFEMPPIAGRGRWKWLNEYMENK